MNVFNMYRGDDKIYELEVTDKQTGNAVDITGTTIKLTLRETPTDSIFLQKSNGPGEHSDPSNGKTEFAIDAADTSSLSNEKHTYVFDVEITKTDTKVETLLIGKFIIIPEVTY